MNLLNNSWDITIEVDNELDTPRYKISRIDYIQCDVESPYQDRYNTLEEAKHAYFKITGRLYKSAARHYYEAIETDLFIKNRYIVCDMPIFDITTGKYSSNGLSISGEIVRMKWQSEGPYSFYDSPEIEIKNTAYAPHLDLSKQLPFETELILKNFSSISLSDDYYGKEEIFLERRLYADCELYIVEKHIHEKVVLVNENPSLILESLKAPSAYRVQSVAAFKEVGKAIFYVQHFFPDMKHKEIMQTILSQKN